MKVDESVLFELTGEKEVFNIPQKLMKMLLDETERKHLISELEKYEHGISCSFQEFFESEIADRKTFKQDYTPQSIGEICSNVVGTGSYLEIASGTGSLAINGQYKELSKLYLTEFSEIALPFLIINMLLRKYDAVISHEDSLSGDVFATYKTTDGKFEVIDKVDDYKAQRIVMNPPYSAKWEPTEDPIFWEYGTPPKAKADFAFILKAFDKLDDNGKMAVVLPHGVLFRGNKEQEIRQNLLDRGYISGVIGLPDKLFANTSIPVCILVLSKQKADSVMFMDASSEFEKVGKNNILTDEIISKISGTFNEKKEIDRYSNLISLDKIKDNDYNLNIPRYVDTFEPEPIIDIYQMQREIMECNAEIEKTSAELSGMFRKLGLPNDFKIL